jgi:hypothetical protein
MNTQQSALWQEELHSEEPKVAQCNPQWKPKSAKPQGYIELPTLHFDDLRQSVCFSVVRPAFTLGMKPTTIRHIVLRRIWLESALRVCGLKIVPMTDTEVSEAKRDAIDATPTDTFACMDTIVSAVTTEQQRESTLDSLFGETP